MTKIIIKKDREELDSTGADIIEKAIRDALKAKEFVVLAVAGGRSVPGIFNNLKEKDIEWEKVHIFLVDERLAPIDSPESNFKLAKESFISSLIQADKLPDKNVHPFILEEDRPDSGIADYTHELKELGGKYDLVLLSAGEDGHVGALYPNHHSVDDESEHFISMHDSPKPPPDRMSMSRKLLLKAHTALVLFLGEGKRDALDRFRDDSFDYRSCPAKLVKEIKDSYLLTDLE